VLLLSLTLALGAQSTSEFRTDSLWKLPKPVASFGAAAVGDALYLFGGHCGHVHEHNSQVLSKDLFRFGGGDGQDWTELACGTPVQGTALVAAKDQLLRIGGMTAKNARGEPDDLHSLASVEAFNPKTGSWQSRSTLPDGRCSHDAVALGHRVVVVGGWTLAGRGTDPKWLDSALSADLTQEDTQW
jgi:N-acetylneuraminic acid mutarotase